MCIRDRLRVYIYASDMEDRIKRIKKNKHISQREALDRIAYKDRQRRDYYNFYTGHEWGKMENYDICLNTSVLSEEECVPNNEPMATLFHVVDKENCVIRCHYCEKEQNRNEIEII